MEGVHETEIDAAVEPVFCRFPGVVGGSVSGKPTLVAMSVEISAPVRALRKIRTSSIIPLNHSGQMLLAPIQRSPAETEIAPPVAIVPTWAAFI